MGTPELTLVGEPVRHSDHAWVRYREAGSSGVLVFRFERRKIAHQWFVVTAGPTSSP
jgi:hypothetical protein